MIDQAFMLFRSDVKPEFISPKGIQQSQGTRRKVGGAEAPPTDVREPREGSRVYM
jgi:hypothetical protein